MNGLLDARGADPARAVHQRRGRHAQLEEIERDPRVAVRVDRNRPQGIRLDIGRLRREPALRIAKCTFENRGDLFCCKAAKHEHFRPRQQRRVDLE